MSTGVLIADIPFSAGEVLTEAHIDALRSVACATTSRGSPSNPSTPSPRHRHIDTFEAHAALLEEARATIRTLQSREGAEVQRLRCSAEEQLRRSSQRVSNLTARLMEESRRVLCVEADLSVTQLRCEELDVLNRHLEEQLRLLLRQLLVQTPVAERLRMEAQSHREVAERHAAANAKLQLQVRDLGAELRSCIDSVERLERRSVAQEEDWAKRLSAATKASDSLTAENVALRLTVQQAEEQLTLTREAAKLHERALEQAEMELGCLRIKESQYDEQLSELQARCQQLDDTIHFLEGGTAQLQAEQEAAAMALEDERAQHNTMREELRQHCHRNEELVAQWRARDDRLASFSAALTDSLTSIAEQVPHVQHEYPAPTEHSDHLEELRPTGQPTHPAAAPEDGPSDRLLPLQLQAASLAQQLRRLEQPSKSHLQLTAVRPLVQQLVRAMRCLAEKAEPLDEAAEEDVVACAAEGVALCGRLKELLEHCSACAELRAQLAAQQRILNGLPKQWEAEEQYQRQHMLHHSGELRIALSSCHQWMVEYDVTWQRQRGREEAVRKWDAQERQQRRSIATAEAEAWSKLWSMAQRFQRWRQTSEVRPPERRKPTVAWIGIEISDLRFSWPSAEGRPSDAAEPIVAGEGAEAGGVKVVAVKGPAARQGVMVGDTITQLNDRATANLPSFKCAAAKVKPGQTVHLTISRPNLVEKVLISVQTSEVDKELFTPGVRHTQKVLCRPDSLITDTCDKENRVPLDLPIPFLSSKASAAEGDGKTVAVQPRVRCRSGPVAAAGASVQPAS